jgi:ABC-type multidrug transport system ATPase subunit
VAEHLDLISSVFIFECVVVDSMNIFLKVLKLFFIKIRGYSKEEIQEEILSISTFVGLNNDLEKKSKQLSGGMKRRLSVAMALTGGSKIIILDEPTSGLG